MGDLAHYAMNRFPMRKASHAVGLVSLASWLFTFCAVPASAQEVATPARAYLYIDPYAARFECLVRMTDMLSILGEQPPDTLTPALQKTLVEKARAKAASWLSLKLDNQAAQKDRLTSVSVVKGSPGRTDAVGPDESLPLPDAMIGLVWDFDLAVIPQQIEIQWNGFVVPLVSLPVSVVMGSQSENFNLTPQSPSNVWNNRGRVNLRTPLSQVPPVRGGEHDSIKLPLATIAWVACSLFYIIFKTRRSRRMTGRKLMRWAALVLGAVVLWPVSTVKVPNPWAPQVVVSPDQATKIMTSLLRNIYRAFDQRTESAVYDVLARSIQGDLLQKIYLQTANALSLDAQSATRIQVSELEVHIDALQQIKKRLGFKADVQWNVLGTVGHWGHQHTRVNRYTAKATVEPDRPINAANSSQPVSWKITALEILEEKRL